MNTNILGSSSVLRITKNATSLVAANVGASLLALAMSLLLTRGLGSDVYGQYVFIAGIAGMAMAFAELGLQRLTVREIARNQGEARNFLFVGVVLRVMAFGVALLILSVWVRFSERLGGMEIIVFIVAGTTGITGLADLLRSLFQAFEKMELDLVSRLAERTLALLICAALLASGGSLLSIVVGLAISALFGVGICVAIAVKLTPPSNRNFRFDITQARTMLWAGIPISLSGLVLATYLRLDVFLIGLLRKPEEVAWFSVAYGLILILTSLTSAVAGALFPVLSRLSQADRDAQAHVLTRSLRYSIVFSIPIAGTVFVAAEPMIGFLYGVEYLPTAQAVQLLSLGAIFMLPTQLLASALIADDRQVWTLGVNIAALALLCATNLALIPVLGFLGAAVANAVVEVVVFCIDFLLVGRSIASIKLGIILRPLGAALLAVSAFALTSTSFPIGLSFVLALVIYGGSLIALKAIQRNDLAFISALVKSVAHRWI